MKHKNYRILGFEYNKVGDVSILSFFSRSIYHRIGKSFCLFGYFCFNQMGDKK